ASGPEFAGAVGFVGKLAIEGQLECQIDGAGGTHSGKSGVSGVAQVRLVGAAANSISQGGRSEFEPESNVGPEARSLDQRLGLDPVVGGPVDPGDQYSRGTQ